MNANMNRFSKEEHQEKNPNSLEIRFVSKSKLVYDLDLELILCNIS
jgi:hypothetical protein